eukprot:1019224-Amphidinium_carterae.2
MAVQDVVVVVLLLLLLLLLVLEAQRLICRVGLAIRSSGVAVRSTALRSVCSASQLELQRPDSEPRHIASTVWAFALSVQAHRCDKQGGQQHGVSTPWYSQNKTCWDGKSNKSPSVSSVLDFLALNSHLWKIGAKDERRLADKRSEFQRRP